MTTFLEGVQALTEHARQARDKAQRLPSGGQAAREYSIAITALEDAQMRFTRGLAMELGVELEASRLALQQANLAMLATGQG